MFYEKRKKILISYRHLQQLYDYNVFCIYASPKLLIVAVSKPLKFAWKVKHIRNKEMYETNKE